MKEVSVGVITAPGLPKKLLEDILEELREEAGKAVDDEVSWQIEYQTDLLASSSEFINDIFDKVKSIKENHGWDMAIAAIDLPSISDGKVVLSDFDYDEKLSLISVPAIGTFRTKHKLESLLIHHMTELYGADNAEEAEEVQFGLLNRITEVTPEEEGGSKNRYVMKSTISGWARLLTGMTYLNEPWKEFSNFKTIMALAFATGTYVSIFRTPWELSLDYSVWRLALLTVIAVFGMVVWLIYTHDLWEKPSGKNQFAYQQLYNLTTLLTLLIITLLNYLVVIVLLTISILIFVPMGLFETWTEVEYDVGWTDYLSLIWFTASLGTLAGAFGSTVEEEDKIRNATYSYRQLFRQRELEEEARKKEEAEEKGEEDQESSETEDDEDYEGEKQTHNEAEEEK